MGGFVLQTVFIAGLLSLIVVVASRMFRLSPAVRFGLWLVVLIKLLAPPVVEWPWDATRLFPETMTQVWVAEGPLPEFSPRMEAVWIPPATDFAMPTDAGLTADIERGLSFTVGQFLLIGWLLGSLVVLFTSARRILRFRQSVSASHPAPNRIVGITGDVAKQLGIRPPPVRVIQSRAPPRRDPSGFTLESRRRILALCARS